MNSRINTRALWGLALASLFAAATSVAQTFEVVHTFTPAEGADPQSGLIQLPDGTFAGTTIGDNDKTPFQLGTLFQMNTSGYLRTIQEFDWTFTGAHPHAPLLLTPDGDLYGTTKNGLVGWGGIFKRGPSTSFNVLHAFIPSTAGAEGEGAMPHAPLILAPGSTSSEGQYYGVTTEGGKDNLGTIFMMDDNNVVTTLYHFSGLDGAEPYESLIRIDKVLYGTTTKGGTAKHGVIYRIDVGGFNFRVLHNFTGNDGANPEAPMIQVDGALYGTTYEGGSNDLGTVFKYELATGRFLVLHNFVSSPMQAWCWPATGPSTGRRPKGAGLWTRTAKPRTAWLRPEPSSRSRRLSITSRSSTGSTSGTVTTRSRA
jgi:uncharacterized repeat protein (TIGR03803 family)